MNLKQRPPRADVVPVVVRRIVSAIMASAVVVGAFVSGMVGAAAAAAKPTSSTSTALTSNRLTSPARTVVSDSASRHVATFTDGSVTVTLTGPERIFDESTAASPVRSTTWVRVLAAPFAGTVDFSWLAAARTDTSLDLLAVAFQYARGAPEVREDAGLISSDASYGPFQADGTRQEGSDWNDYLGVTATYGTVTDAPEAHQIGALDCSGFVRMVYGRRIGLALSLDPDGRSIPRRAFQIEQSAPGITTIPNRGTQSTSFSRLAPGDLVFFDAATDDGIQIDHVGLYLGPDTSGRHRFFSSRKAADGPTMGDERGMSVLDGTGLYARAFRSARRL